MNKAEQDAARHAYQRVIGSVANQTVESVAANSSIVNPISIVNEFFQRNKIPSIKKPQITFDSQGQAHSPTFVAKSKFTQ